MYYLSLEKVRVPGPRSLKATDLNHALCIVCSVKLRRRRFTRITSILLLMSKLTWIRQ